MIYGIEKRGSQNSAEVDLMSTKASPHKAFFYGYDYER